jgi:hypothetical protein
MKGNKMSLLKYGWPQKGEVIHTSQQISELPDRGVLLSLGLPSQVDLQLNAVSLIDM